MRVVGDSGVVMDLPEHVATGLLSSGVVTRVDDSAAVEVAEPLQPPAAVPPTPPAGGPETAPGSDGGTVPAEVLAGTQDEGLKLPPGNGTREVWADFALAHGKTEDDLNGLTQTDIRNLFKPAAE